MPNEIKRVCLGQLIVQATRPRSVIAPIPFSVGTTLEKCFASKYLLTLLSKLGISVSSAEVTQFKVSAAITAQECLAEGNCPNEVVVDENEDEECDDDNFAHWVADNIDHNLMTLTGKGTIHNMGTIQATNSSQKQAWRSIPRLRDSNNSNFTSTGVHILPYDKARLRVDDTLKPIQMSSTEYPDGVYNDLLWHCGSIFNVSRELRPNWFGFMQSTCSYVQTFSKSKIDFLPIIDLKSTDESCIYSTLMFVVDQAKKQKVRSASITFDQPLWQKAMSIIKSESLPIVCRLGGFHTLMSFLGSLGVLMQGSGLEEVFEEVYAPNVIPHMMSGKVVTRALRAHIIAQSALMTLLIRSLEEQCVQDLESLKSAYKKAVGRELDISSEEELPVLDVLKRISSQLRSHKQVTASKSRTAKLWISYCNYVDVVKMFVYAERTSDWELHLHEISKMLNLFAATGHNNYAKFARFYLQEMRQLPQKDPWLYGQFLKGKHTVKMAESGFNAVWSDLGIEQSLMRSIKSRGGLTRGRGMTENVRDLWVMSLSSSASIQNALEDLTGARQLSNLEHVELGKSRKMLDCDHYCKVVETAIVAKTTCSAFLRAVDVTERIAAIQNQ